jgi:hypothetical protein
MFNRGFRKNYNNPLDGNLMYTNDNKFYFKNFRKETGELMRMGFERINGEWYLTLYLVNAC